MSSQHDTDPYAAPTIGAAATPPVPPPPSTTTERRQRGILLPVATTAVLAAVLAAGGTAALTTLDDGTAAGGTTQATDFSTLGRSGSGGGVPVASSTSAAPDWQTVSDAVAPSVVAITVVTDAGGGQGSGVIIDGEGHILTNDHVVSGAKDDTVRVILSDGRVYDATITGLDPATDLAVVTIVDAPDDLAPAVMSGGDPVDVGEPVMAVGNPLGLSNTVTTGIVSALDRPVSTATTTDDTVVVTNAIQIDAAINPGNSGGPLFDATGEVIGITSSIASLSAGGGQGGSIGLGFAIPSDLAQNIGEQLIADGTAEHAFLGVAMTSGTGTVDGTTRQGAVVKEVSDGSPADGALEVDDVIVAIDGDPVTGSESLTGFVRALPSGADVTLTVVRDGESVDVSVTLATKTDDATTNPDPQRGSGGSSGTPDGSSGGSGDRPGSDGPSGIPDLRHLFPGDG